MTLRILVVIDGNRFPADVFTHMLSPAMLGTEHVKYTSSVSFYFFISGHPPHIVADNTSGLSALVATVVLVVLWAYIYVTTGKVQARTSKLQLTD